MNLDIQHMALKVLTSFQIPAYGSHNVLLNLLILICLGYCVIKCFFSNIKRGGILLTQIAVGSLYLFSLPRGLTEGFTGWWFESSVNEYAAKMLRKIRGVFVFRQEKPMLNLWFLPFALF